MRVYVCVYVCIRVCIRVCWLVGKPTWTKVIKELNYIYLRSFGRNIISKIRVTTKHRTMIKFGSNTPNLSNKESRRMNMVIELLIC